MSSNNNNNNKPCPPCLFEDFDKCQRDLATENFPDSFKVEVGTKTDNNLEFAGSVTRTGDNVKGSVTPKFSFPAYKSVIKTTVDTSSLIKVDTTISELVEGVKINVVSELGPCTKGKFNVDYKHAKFATALTLSGSSLPNGPFNLDTSLAVPIGCRFLAGSSLSVSNLGAENDIKSVKGGLFYKEKQFTIGATVTSGSQSMGNRSLVGGLSYFQTVNASTNVGASVSYDLRGGETSMCLALSHKLRDDLTSKVKVGSCGLVAASLSQKINPNVNLLLGGQVNMIRGLSSAKDNKVGFNLSFKN
eukprot:CAMPEP_0177630010 /NCGR_PEP_ID=MMETSP0447-20121125/980_1 /TAXON_ID=0 /ORGANISM="Stygamoeba regulata, Strain BSH-02190019" /LENGTH=302 /DNA_ID=CAMNT_0019131383 /DNA_START=48 /DNA_END=956 /DNA_ORIENTATION=-